MTKGGNTDRSRKEVSKRRTQEEKERLSESDRESERYCLTIRKGYGNIPECVRLCVYVCVFILTLSVQQEQNTSHQLRHTQIALLSHMGLGDTHQMCF